VLVTPFVVNELLSPGWLQSTRQHRLAATDSVAFIRAARQHDPEQSLSPSRCGLTPTNELPATEAIKHMISRDLSIEVKLSLFNQKVSIVRYLRSKIPFCKYLESLFINHRGDVEPTCQSHET